MPTVDFLPFATGGSALVASQATYAASSYVTNGFQVGIADPSALNKAWRQSAFQAAVLANFVSQQINADVLDNGNLSAAVTNLTTAVTNLVAAGARWSGTSAGTAGAMTITPNPASASYATGAAYAFVAGTTNIGATTLNVSGLGAKNIYKDSPAGPIPLTGGEIFLGNVITVRYDGTQFQLSDTDLGTMAQQNANAVTISGGTIDGAVVGGSTPAAGHFTTLQATGHVTFEGVTSTGATGTNLLVFGTSPTLASPTFTGTVAGAGTIPVSTFQSQAAYSILGNATSGSAAVTAITSATYSITDQSGASLVITGINLRIMLIGPYWFIAGGFSYPSTASGATASLSLPGTQGTGDQPCMHGACDSAISATCHILFTPASGTAAMALRLGTTFAALTNAQCTANDFKINGFFPVL